MVEDAHIVQSSLARNDFHDVAGEFVRGDNHGDANDLDGGDIDHSSGDNMDGNDDPNDADYVSHNLDNLDNCSNTQLLLAARKLLSMMFGKYSNDNYDYCLADKDLSKEERRIEYANGEKKKKVGHHCTNHVKGGPLEPSYKIISTVKENIVEMSSRRSAGNFWTRSDGQG